MLLGSGTGRPGGRARSSWSVECVGACLPETWPDALLALASVKRRARCWPSSTGESSPEFANVRNGPWGPEPQVASGGCQRATEYANIRGTSMANNKSKPLNSPSSLPGVWSNMKTYSRIPAMTR